MTTFQFKSVYVQGSGVAVGPLEKEGPLGKYFQVAYEDNTCGESTFEKAERRLIKDAVDQALLSAKCSANDIQLCYGGDLINQCASSNYFAKGLDIPFISVYGACSNAALVMGEAAIAVEHLVVERVLAFTSSHNATAERQFRYPNEYGGQKKETTTFTVTGSGAVVLSKAKSDIQVTSFTVGKVNDWNFSDANDMGKAMTPAAFSTLMSHFEDVGRTFDDYDLIVTGDLSKIGYSMMSELCQEKHFQLDNKLNDCGLMIYDIKNQPVFCGGSGCGCSMIVTLTKLFDMLRKNEAKRILLIATGALLSPIVMQQKESIPCIAHAICFERGEIL